MLMDRKMGGLRRKRIGALLRVGPVPSARRIKEIGDRVTIADDALYPSKGKGRNRTVQG
jgi:hypothetical protein